MSLGFLKKITDFIMPLEPIEEEEPQEELERKAEPAKGESKQEKLERRVEQPNLQETVSARVSPISEPAMEMSEMTPQMADLGKMRTAEGGSVAFGGMKYTAYAVKEEPVSSMKPQLTVVKGSGISVKINKPAKFEEVRLIADDLLGKNVVIVNYELVEPDEQRRINDFVNGVCYVTDGHVEQISERIVLYTPEGIDAEAAMLKYAMR